MNKLLSLYYTLCVSLSLQMWAKHYFVLSTDKLIFTEQQEKEEEPEKEDEPEVTHSFCSLATHMTAM